MVQLSPRQMVVAVLRNLAHRLLGGIRRGGHKTAVWSEEARRAHGESIYRVLSPYVGDVAGQTGLEIGPGDNLEVCGQFLKAGGEKMIAVERYAQPPQVNGVSVLRAPIESMNLDRQVDFAFSNDAFEHVADVPVAMKAIYKALKPGGRFICNIDLRGHNVFNRPQRPLDFLTCPDGLWRMMFSHIATTNRVRAHEFVQAAEGAGFVVKTAKALASADPAYLASVKPHMLPRYQRINDEELGIVQYLLVLERPVSTRQAVA
ncbi:class I SAM-dependent methyltransferase [Aquabacterium sp. A7-Y]|uniref:class I SAM-dependent methyltransferase n=1 Tax=Aquabacterium sp. A7-Y TaxID=1349605 RepID=UPI00223DFFD5|nr:class I SAM-dependent methyltransferase [Aquabacterium sp. A7-Y]MCW7541383.1 class I SAM-dependent methyltransferase [Aquabacterium sp. A7-Y]